MVGAGDTILKKMLGKDIIVKQTKQMVTNKMAVTGDTIIKMLLGKDIIVKQT